MNISLFDANICLDNLIYRLPKAFRYEYYLCRNEDELYELAGRIMCRDSQELKECYHKLMNSENYLNSYDKKAWSGTTFGLSTYPILLNHADIKDFKHLAWTYLHEIGHIIGHRSKHRLYWGENVAILIANKLSKKLNI